MDSKQKSDWLKLLAMISMLIDHCGVLLFPNAQVLRLIGRLAFPIFAWGIARGFKYTRNRRKYMLLLFRFGALSQLPYMYLNRTATIDYYTINQIWQFLYSIFVLLAVEKAQKSGPAVQKGLFGVLAFLLAFLPDIVRFYYPQWKFSYGTYGILMSVLFYFFEGRRIQTFLAYLALSYFYDYSSVVHLTHRPELSYIAAYLNISENIGTMKRYGVFAQFLSIMALPLIQKAEMQPGKLFLPKLVAYLFYPVHITLLLFIRFSAF